MAILIKGDNIGEVWSDLLKKLIQHGEPAAPRGFETREILNVSIEIKNGLKNVLVNSTRDINYRFLIAEWLWMLAGFNEVELLAKYNSVMRNFSDDGQILNGAYGPRLASQWEYIFDSLKQVGSRQAVSIIWSENPGPSKDIPCTISLQWFVRNHFLHCTVNMRSSDVWLGLPYDYFSFSQLTNYVASRVGVRVGSLTMNLGSSHLYKTDFSAACAAAWVPTTYVESPRLSHLIDIPKRGKMLKILEGNYHITSVGYPWNEYGEALTENKIRALEVLRGIEPIK